MFLVYDQRACERYVGRGSALDRRSRREHFTAPGELVFCNVLGYPLDGPRCAAATAAPQAIARAVLREGIKQLDYPGQLQRINRRLQAMPQTASVRIARQQVKRIDA